MPASLAQQPSLRVLRLNGNGLAGDVLAFAAALRPDNLIYHLSLADNHLSGASGVCVSKRE